MNVYEEVRAFYDGFRGEKRVIGKSREGRDIFALFIGSAGGPVGISTYAMHAREWITAYPVSYTHLTLPTILRV